MVKVGSMQSNDLLIEFSPRRDRFQLVNMVPALEDSMVREFLETVFNGINAPVEHMKVFFCGANQWVVRARAYALVQRIEQDRKQGETND